MYETNSLLELENGDEEITTAEGTVSFSDAAADAVADANGDTATSMVEHADKAREIADGLDELADKAEELAGEDVDHAVAAVAVESLHREFRTWMRSNELSYKATSFESSASIGDDPKVQLGCLSKDARRVSLQARGHYNELMNFSPEGAIMQFLRGDIATLNNAVGGLSKAIGDLTLMKGKFENGLVIYHGSLARLMQRQNRSVKDFEGEVGKDIDWINGLVAFIDKHYGEMISAAAGDQTFTPLDAGKLATGKAELLGNRTLNIDLKYKNDSNFNGPALRNSAGLGSAYVLVLGLTSSLPPLGAIAAGALVTAGAYNLMKDASFVYSNSSLESVTALVKRLIGLRDINTRLAKYDTSKLDNVMRGLKSKDADLHRQITVELSRLHRLIEVAYEHARFLLIQTTATITNAVEVARIGHRETEGENMHNTLQTS